MLLYIIVCYEIILDSLYEDEESKYEDEEELYQNLKNLSIIIVCVRIQLINSLILETGFVIPCFLNSILRLISFF